MSNGAKFLIGFLSIIMSLFIAGILVLMGMFTNFDNYGPQKSALGAYIYAGIVVALGFSPLTYFIYQDDKQIKTQATSKSKKF